MTRIVLDTNILVSALLRPDSIPAQVLSLATRRRVEICITPAEYEEVLSRASFAFTPELTARALAGIRATAVWVDAAERIRACADVDDNVFLECAVAGNAEYLVTGNLKHFPPSYSAVRVVSPRWMLDQIVARTDEASA